MERLKLKQEGLYLWQMMGRGDLRILLRLYLENQILREVGGNQGLNQEYKMIGEGAYMVGGV